MSQDQLSPGALPMQVNLPRQQPSSPPGTPALAVKSRIRQDLGQFFTDDPVADFMASLFHSCGPEVSLLDAGAGSGALSDALVRHWCAAKQKPKKISLTAFEIDPTLLPLLRVTLAGCQRQCDSAGIPFSAKVYNEDFIKAATSMVQRDLFASEPPRFNAAIVNPPYRKIRTDSADRKLLSQAGIETSNLYTGFVALIIRLLAPGGEMVGITPRSFCNGPYFRPFRKEFLHTMALQRLHVFESRTAAFKRDKVLQENIIFHAVKGRPKPDRVIISSSSGAPAGAITECQVPYATLVAPGDPQQFIHLTADDQQAKARKVMNLLSTTLPDIGLMVSTGRVVDFRAKEFLRDRPDHDTVPLIYPCHFNGVFVRWPMERSRKPNAIVNNPRTRSLLVPAGIYVLVKRFSPKEERRRVVACIWDPDPISAELIGFENHLNYFHINGLGLPMALAQGLAAFLNSAGLDAYFRQFNGHTQVNATDLRSLKYPTKAQLERIGQAISDSSIPQKDADAFLEKEFF